MLPATLSPLEQTIVMGLQMNGRASWRQIAAVVGQPERTVARVGTRLLAEGIVRVVALEHERVGRGDPSLLRLRCTPRDLREAAASLAARDGSLWVYAVAGTSEAAAEVFCPAEDLADYLLQDIAVLPGLREYSAHPVIQYFKTIDAWQPGLSDLSTLATLTYSPTRPIEQFGPPIDLDAVDRVLIDNLKLDGRLTHEQLAGLVGVSKATVGRRVEALRDTGTIAIRAVIEPVLLGYPVEAVLWIKCVPEAIDAVGEALAQVPEVRYVAAIAGEHQLVAQVAMPSRTELHRLISAHHNWARQASSVEVSLVVEVYKRSNLLPNPQS